jgi:hypothetical protein
MLSKLFNQISEDTAAFTYAIAGRSVDNETAVNTDDHVIVESESGMHGMDDVYRGLHTAIAHSDSLVVFTAKRQMQSMGSIAAVRSIIDESQISDWGVERRDDTEIQFENGSRIVSITLANGGNSIRGMEPEFISINETSVDVDSDVADNVIEPMVSVSDCDVWLNTDDVGESDLAPLHFDDGAYVRRID